MIFISYERNNRLPLFWYPKERVGSVVGEIVFKKDQTDVSSTQVMSRLGLLRAVTPHASQAILIHGAGEGLENQAK